jgi:antirestriction protein
MMKVKDLIKRLKKYNNLDDEIISVYWTYDNVFDSYDDFNKSHWLELVSRFDNYDFQQTCDDIQDVLNEIREEE